MLKNKLLVGSLIPLPLIVVAIPIIFVAATRGQPFRSDEVEIYRRLSPAFGEMDPGEIMQLVVVGQLMFMLLLTPVIGPLTIATFSIIGEKQARSLEPLLATPVRTWELLLGKSLAAIIPAVLVTWISYLILVAGMAAVASPHVFAGVVSPMWILAIALFSPLLGTLAVNLGVMVSSRVNDTRVAQQVGGLIVLPLIGIGIFQTAGMVLYDVRMFAFAAIGLAALDVAVLVVTARIFQRETILTRWK